MEAAKRDPYGVPGILGQSKQETVAIRATETGNLHVTDNKVLLQVIKLNLAIARQNELIYEGDYFNEMTINIVDAKVQLNFVDADDASKNISIVRPMSLSTSADKLWISNIAATGDIEIWLWR